MPFVRDVSPRTAPDGRRTRPADADRSRRVAAGRPHYHALISNDPRPPTQGPLPLVAGLCAVAAIHRGGAAPCPSRPSASSSRPPTATSAASATPSRCPPLTDVQTRSYDRFLQLDVAARQARPPTGLEGVLQEIFPIESYDKKIALEYVKYELGKPRYDPDECRQLRLTYGRPFRVWLRLQQGTARPSRKKSTSATCRS